MTLFHRKPKATRLVLVAASRAGQSGWSVFVDGQWAAWGRTETAAMAAYQVARVA